MMMNKKIKIYSQVRLLLLSAVCHLLPVASSAQDTHPGAPLAVQEIPAKSTKEITVSAEESFTDHLALKNDSKDMDLMVKFVFDEAQEQLTVSLISYRQLFVFQDNVRYAQVVKGNALRPDRFPYVVAADKEQEFRLSPIVRKSFPKPRKQYVFRRWINYEGLIPQPVEYKMVNDYIEQKFDIKNKQSDVKVTLHDVFLMDPDAKKSTRYHLVGGRDLSISYQVHIQRNPCFGKDEEIANAQKTLESLQKGFRPFYAKYKSGKVNLPELQTTFNKTREVLNQQFPPHTAESQCAQLQDVWNQYNQCLDTLNHMKCEVAQAETVVEGILQGGVQPSFVLSKARQIDTMVSRWLYTSDKAERTDLTKNIRIVIKDGQDVIKSQGVFTDEQRKAVKLFQTAIKYFHATCIHKEANETK